MSRFRDLRVSAGLTQKDVADKLGISQVSVWQWENEDMSTLQVIQPQLYANAMRLLKG